MIVKLHSGCLDHAAAGNIWTIMNPNVEQMSLYIHFNIHPDSPVATRVAGKAIWVGCGHQEEMHVLDDAGCLVICALMFAQPLC